MADRLITVATFSVDFEAELVKNRLEEEGIRVSLLGETATGLYQLGYTLGGIQVQVAEEDAERALRILASLPLEREVHVEGWDQSPDEDDEGPDPEPETSITGRPGTTFEPATSITAHPETVRAEKPDAEEEKAPSMSAVDAIAFRAWRSAIIGLLMCPPLVFHIYSVAMLIWLASVPGELSERGKRRLYGAVLIDIAVFAVLGLYMLSSNR